MRKISKYPTVSQADPVIDLHQAISILKTTRPTFYRWLRSGRIKGMKAGRQWRFHRAELDRFLQGDSPRVEIRADIQPLLQLLDSQLKQAGTKPAAGNAFDPLASAVDRLLRL